MRTRAILAILTTALAGSVAAGGCQFIAQLNVLEVSNGGSGSGDGGTGGGSSTSSSSSGTPACLEDAGNGTCGTSSVPPCPLCDSDQSCPLRCVSGQGCPTTINTSEYAIILTCDSSGSCAGHQFTCSGSHLCEVDCKDPGSCEGMTLTCGSGPCRLRCAGMACGDPDAGPDAGPFLKCGTGACDVSWFGPSGALLPVMPANCSSPCCTQTREGG